MGRCVCGEQGWRECSGLLLGWMGCWGGGDRWEMLDCVLRLGESHGGDSV